MSYSTGTIDCSGLQTTTLHIKLYCDLQEDTCNNIKIIVARCFV